MLPIIGGTTALRHIKCHKKSTIKKIRPPKLPLKQAFCMRGSGWPGCCSYKWRQVSLCSHRSEKNLCSDHGPGAFPPFLSVSVPGHGGGHMSSAKQPPVPSEGLETVQGAGFCFPRGIVGRETIKCLWSIPRWQWWGIQENNMSVFLKSIRIEKWHWAYRVLNECSWFCHSFSGGGGHGSLLWATAMPWDWIK